MVIAAEFEFAPVFFVQHEEIVCLHEHIVEFEEGEPPFVARLEALRRKHLIDGEMHADLAQKVDVVEVQKPIGVVDHDRAVFAFEVDELRHLFAETLAVIVHRFARHHKAHVRPSGRIADHARAAADQHDGLMPRVLHVLHCDQLHEMPDVQAVRRGIEPDIKGNALAPEHFVKLVFVNGLFDESPLPEGVHYVFRHCCLRNRAAGAENSLFLFIDFDSNTFDFVCKTNDGRKRQIFLKI